MITFEQIQKANEGLATISLKDKDYVQVAQRVLAFRKLFPEGFITTDILSLENGVVTMKTEVGYYAEGRKNVLSTGMAYEKESNGFVNKTSFIENCETSSVGRALGFLALGIDGGSIASAEELANALLNQQKTQPAKPVKKNQQKPAEESSADQQDSSSSKPIDLSELRSQLDAAIKAKTRDMDRAAKVAFIDQVIKPTLQGERNWKLCEDLNLLQNLLSVVAA